MVLFKRLGIVAAILVAAYVLWRVFSPMLTSKDPQILSQHMGESPKDPPSVIAIVANPQPFSESVTLSGSITANEFVELRSELNGRIIKIGFREGADVKVGQLLVKFDDSELLARHAKLTQQALLDKSRKNRLEKLRAVDGVSLDDYESAVADLEIRKAEIAELDALIAKTELRAPFSGRVGLRNVSVGAVVNPQTVLATLTSVGLLNVDFSVPERYSSVLAHGSAVSFRVRNLDTALRRAVIAALEPIVDVGTRTQRVRARIEDSRSLTAGMFADVTLSLNRNDSEILIPTESVVQDMKGASVFRIEKGVARSVPVVLGGRTNTSVVVKSGLNAGDTVVASGILFVKDGKPVKVTLR